MNYFKLVQYLKANGFKSVMLYTNREVWEKNQKQLTIPLNYDTDCSMQLVTKIKEKAKYY